MSELDFQNLDKCIDLIGKEIYAFESVYAGHPYIKCVKVNSIEIYGNKNIQIKTANDGSFYPSGYNAYFYTSREEAEQKLEEKYGAKTVDAGSLKDCPICHGISQIKQRDYRYFIQCKDCGLQTKESSKLLEVIDLWNDRK